MAKISHEEVLIALLGWLLLMVFVGMIWVWGWAIWRLLTGRRIIPEQPMVSDGRARWGMGTVLLVLLLYVVVSSLSQWGYLWAAGRLPKKPSAAPRAVAVAVANPTLTLKEKKIETRDDANSAKTTKPAADKSKKDRESLLETEVMFLVSVINSVLLVLIPLLVRFTSGARLRDLGICLNGWMRQAALGVGATLFVIPIIYAVQLVVLLIWPPDPSNDHPLKKMLEEQFTAGVVYLAFLSAVILAPMLEELIFRAIFQGWLSAWLGRRRNTQPRRPLKPSAPLQALADDGFAADNWELDTDAETNHWEKAPTPSDPSVDESHRFPWPAVVLTSLFFAIVHLPQWPAPIALFVLSLALGTVYQRTGSLIASIFMHATFNGLSTIALIGAILLGQAAEKKKLTSKTTIERSDPVALGRQWVIEAIGRHRAL
jgi:membrane protease YdiL (CAAX protease family)